MEILSDKRKELFDTWNRVGEGIPNSLIKSIEEQDRNFIHQLKEEISFQSINGDGSLICGLCQNDIDKVIKIIDKLAGRKLLDANVLLNETDGKA